MASFYSACKPTKYLTEVRVNMLKLFKTMTFGVMTGALLTLTGCPPRPTVRPPMPPSFQPSAEVQSGLRVLTDYSIYLSEFAQGQSVNLITDPIPFSVFPLVVPGSKQAVLPPDLSNMLQNDFTTLLNRVPASQSTHVQGWNLRIADCSGSNQVLWLGRQAKAEANGGSICLSPLLVRALFIELSTGVGPGIVPPSVAGVATPSVQLVAAHLLQRDSSNPLGFNGNSRALITNWGARHNQNLSPDDIDALAGAIDGYVEELGGSVFPAFKDCIDYLLAREIVKTYLTSGDETAIATAAAALVQEPGGQLTLSPVSGVLFQATNLTNYVNWGVSNVGDGQKVLDGMNSIAGHN